jgi:hypothetical protein
MLISFWIPGCGQNIVVPVASRLFVVMYRIFRLKKRVVMMSKLFQGRDKLSRHLLVCHG